MVKTTKHDASELERRIAKEMRITFGSVNAGQVIRLAAQLPVDATSAEIHRALGVTPDSEGLILELRKGKKYYLRLVYRNGEPAFTTETYYSEWGARRAAKRVLKLNPGLEFRDML